jgi:hypothetical protein
VPLWLSIDRNFPTWGDGIVRGSAILVLMTVYAPRPVRGT